MKILLEFFHWVVQEKDSEKDSHDLAKSMKLAIRVRKMVQERWLQLNMMFLGML